MKSSRFIAVLSALSSVSILSAQTLPGDDALLFYQSCDHTLQADVHRGNGQPNFVAEITQIHDGAKGNAFHCGDSQLLSYWAPGNIYAQRGTFSFYWRSGQELTDVEFPIWRVAYADHSSWDMVWMRIDYNGSGFDAFVTDNGLSRLRLSYKDAKGLDPNHWYHIVFTWDENIGVALWVDDKKVGEKRQRCVLDTGLDQMGPHSRIISPYQVQTAYNCVRGGDIDELRIYSTSIFPEAEASNQRLKTEAWLHRYGFDNATKAPLLDAETTTTVRKVQIQKAYDEKRWYWKGCDGISETTWPGVYNRSRLAGRFDYIQLPDWDCYSTSGKRVRFIMPEEPWNQIEVTGSAFGSLAVSADTLGTDARPAGSITQGAHHSVVRLPEAVEGQTLVFTNVLQEEPIQELDAYYVHAGDAPEGICRLSYTVSAFQNFNHPRLLSLEQWIDSRYPAEERQKLLALPENRNPNKTSFTGTTPLKGTLEVAESEMAGNGSSELPLFHVIIPNDVRDLSDYQAPSLSGNKARTGDTGLATITRSLNYSWRYMQGGLDGIELSLPALQSAQPEEPIQLNLRIKDPLWPMRDMMDFTCCVLPNHPYSLWLDLRDRILPNDKPLYFTLALSDPSISLEQLSDLAIQLVFKPLDEAREEHVTDRMTQIIDSHAQLVEEGTSTRKLNKYLQLEQDMEDLLRVAPDHQLARKYWYQYNNEQVAPAFTLPTAPEGVPQWALLQLEVLREYRELIEWYIDKRQIENGEFGGGLSDDTDLGNLFPGLILNGCIPEKATESLHRMLEAIYDQGLLTRGVSSLMTDGLHTYEEGGNTIVQCNLAEQGNPLQVERMMETARTVRDWLLGHNEKGHLHFRSDYFSADRIADRGTWTWSSPRQFLHLAPACMLGELYGNQEARRYVIEFVESLLAHSSTEANGEVKMPVEINYLTDDVRRWGTYFSSSLLWYCYLWTGEQRYLDPLLTTSTHKFYTQPISTDDVAEQCIQLLHAISDRRFMMREGSVWIDRVYFNCDDIQRQRLGGITLNRGSNFVPGNAVSWHFADPELAQQVAILIPVASRDKMEVIFWNTANHPIEVDMIGMEVLGGTWQINGKTKTWGRNQALRLTIPARQEYHLEMKLQGPGEDYNNRPDLAIGTEDISLSKNRRSLQVKLHNLGAKAAPATQVILLDSAGNRVAEATSEEMVSPQDLTPSTQVVTLTLPKKMKLDGYRIVIDPDHLLDEIYEQNNEVTLHSGVSVLAK